MSERRIINIFKTFIERVFVPQLPKMDLSCQQEWNKFSSMISTQPFNFSQIQLYVETIPSTNNLGFNNNRQTFEKQETKSPLFSKIKKEISIEQSSGSSGGFNPSKTFGPERARMIFKEDQTSPEQTYNLSKDFSK